MSRRRGRPLRGVALATLIVAALAAVLLAAGLVRLLGSAVRASRTGGEGGRDPQFAEPAEVVTRPPESEGEPLALEEDPSAAWEQGELTPVDKTVEELAREALSSG